MPKQSKQFNMRASPKLLARLNTESRKSRLTKTQFIRRLLIRYFEEQDLKQSLEAGKE